MNYIPDGRERGDRHVPSGARAPDDSGPSPAGAGSGGGRCPAGPDSELGSDVRAPSPEGDGVLPPRAPQEDEVLPLGTGTAAGEAPPTESSAAGNDDEKSRSGILEALALVCVAFALALTLKSYVAEAYEIKGKSMEPSFKTGQRVIVLKTLYEVERGDVVVFSSKEDAGKDLIKRVVGLPGDRIAWHGGRVYVNGEPLNEEYVKRPAFEDLPGEEVPPGQFYVLGDNRPDSHDSRYFHCIPERNLKGEVVLRWWPFEDFHFFVK